LRARGLGDFGGGFYGDLRGGFANADGDIQAGGLADEEGYGFRGLLEALRGSGDRVCAGRERGDEVVPLARCGGDAGIACGGVCGGYFGADNGAASSVEHVAAERGGDDLSACGLRGNEEQSEKTKHGRQK